MLLRLERFANNGDATLGLLWLDGTFQCFTLEDEPRDIKIPGETRIPAGLYNIKLRCEGGMHGRYSSKLPYHGGMLWLQDVPDFEWIYIHIGNQEDHTAGCILVGEGAMASANGWTVQRSGSAYSSLYRKVVSSAEQGMLQISISDRDI